MNPVLLFFFFGFLAGLLKCKIKSSESVSELLTMILLITIGLKGGMQLYGQNIFALLPKLPMVASLGLIIPMIIYPLLTTLAKMKRVDAASLAAHYGSVSVGTFAVCIAYLNSQSVSFEPYVPLFVIILEIPALIVGLVMAKKDVSEVKITSLLEEVFRSKAIVFSMKSLAGTMDKLG